VGALNNMRERRLKSKIMLVALMVLVVLSFQVSLKLVLAEGTGNFSVAAEDGNVSAYFGEAINAKITVDSPSGGDSCYYLRFDADRAQLDPGVATGDTFTVTDKNNNIVTIYKTDDGCYFELNNLAEMKTEFVLPFVSTQDANVGTSNPATIDIYTGTGADKDSAKASAEASTQPGLSFAWSASGDTLQYNMSIYWNDPDEAKRYNIEEHTYLNTTLTTTCVVNIITSSSTYNEGMLEARIPYVLWKYRDNKGYCVPSQISIPKAPDKPVNNDVKYNYYIDDKGTEDLLDDELVIQNCSELTGGTNSTIEIQYMINPNYTIDMSQKTLTLKGKGQTTLQQNPEEYTFNSISYLLDTGHLAYDITLKSPGYGFVYSMSQVNSNVQEAMNRNGVTLDFDNYRYIKYRVRGGYSRTNQGVNFEFEFDDPESTEEKVIGVYRSVIINSAGGSYGFLVDTNKWNYQTSSNFTGQYSYADWEVYVQYPKNTQEFNGTISVNGTTIDPDSHLEADNDYYDLSSSQVSISDIKWEGYNYQIGELEDFEKYSYQTFPGGVSVLGAGSSPGVASWNVYYKRDGNLITSDSQKVKLYDDYLFWNTGANGSYELMKEGDYEFVSVRGMQLYIDQVNLDNGEKSKINTDGLKAELLGYRNGSWETIDTITYSDSGKGKSSQGEDTINLKGKGYTRVMLESPELVRGQIRLYMYVDLEVNPDSDTLKEWISNNPGKTLWVYNVAGTQYFNKDGSSGEYQWQNPIDSTNISYSFKDVVVARDEEEICHDQDKCILRSATYANYTSMQKRSRLVKKLMSKTNNSVDRRVDVKFSLEERECTNVTSTFWNSFPEMKKEFSQREGYFYDLLPEGFCYNDDYEPVVKGLGKNKASVTDFRIINNYKGTGRQMVIFKVEAAEEDSNVIIEQLFPSSDFYGIAYNSPNGSASYTGFRIEFMTYIPWEDLIYSTNDNTNYAAFMGVKEIGGASKDDGSSFRRLLDANGQYVFYDMDGDGVIKEKSTLYATANASVSDIMSLEVGINKRVRGNSGVWSSEDYTNVNDTYSYRVGVVNSATGTINNLIIYDILESAANTEGATGEVSWRGTLESVDVSHAKSRGINPVIYYSTVRPEDGMDYNTETGNTPDNWLEDTSVWSTTMPSDKSKITAIAVDMRKTSNGANYSLPNNSGVYIEIIMKAPDTLPQIDNSNMIYAINRPAYSCYRKTNTAVSGEYATVIGQRVQISIEDTTRSVKKHWDDADNQDGKRPEYVEIKLMADGQEFDTVRLTEAMDWEYTWEHLPLRAVGGKEIVYTVEEITAPEGYISSTITENGNIFELTNSHTPELINISAEKIWDDEENQDGKRPESITLRLYADDVEIKECTVTKDEDWKCSFDNLPKYKAGKEIEYTVEEDEVSEYTTAVDEINSGKFQITNSYIPEQVTVAVTKIWDDEENQDGKRPESITIRLYADDVEVKECVVTEKEGWKCSFEKLPKYKAGKEIKYTVIEDEVPEYSTRYEGDSIINTLIIETPEPDDSDTNITETPTTETPTTETPKTETPTTETSTTETPTTETSTTETSTTETPTTDTPTTETSTTDTQTTENSGSSTDDVPDTGEDSLLLVLMVLLLAGAIGLIFLRNFDII